MNKILVLLIAIDKEDIGEVKKLLLDCDPNQRFNEKDYWDSMPDDALKEYWSSNEPQCAIRYNGKTALESIVEKIIRHSQSLRHEGKLNILFMLLNNGADHTEDRILTLVSQCQHIKVRTWLDNMLKFMNAFDKQEQIKLTEKTQVFFREFIFRQFKLTTQDFITDELWNKHVKCLGCLKQQINSNFLILNLANHAVLCNDEPFIKWVLIENWINKENINITTQCLNGKYNILDLAKSSSEIYHLLQSRGAKHIKEFCTIRLCNAINQGNINCVRELIEKVSPLFKIVIDKKTLTIFEYIREKYDLTSKNSQIKEYGQILIMMALDHRVSMDEVIHIGAELLNIAPNFEIYKALKAKGATLNPNSNECLVFAAYNYIENPTEDNFKHLEYLLRDGINLNLEDKYGDSPLTHITRYMNRKITDVSLKNYDKLIQLFKEHGANIKDILFVEYGGDAILCCTEEIEIVKILMNHGARFNYENLMYWIMSAIEIKDYQFIKNILSDASDASLSNIYKLYNRDTIFTSMIKDWNPHIFQCLLSKVPSIVNTEQYNMCARHGDNFFHRVINTGNIDKINVCLLLGADLQFKNNNGYTAKDITKRPKIKAFLETEEIFQNPKSDLNILLEVASDQLKQFISLKSGYQNVDFKAMGSEYREKCIANLTRFKLFIETKFKNELQNEIQILDKTIAICEKYNSLQSICIRKLVGSVADQAFYKEFNVEHAIYKLGLPKTVQDQCIEYHHREREIEGLSNNLDNMF